MAQGLGKVVSSALRFMQDLTRISVAAVNRMLEQFEIGSETVSHRSAVGTLALTVVVLLLGALILHWKLWRGGSEQSDKSLPIKLPLPPGNFGLPFLGETLSFLSALRANEPERFFLVMHLGFIKFLVIDFH